MEKSDYKSKPLERPENREEERESALRSIGLRFKGKPTIVAPQQHIKRFLSSVNDIF
jgi:hypothetical protein